MTMVKQSMGTDGVPVSRRERGKKRRREQIQKAAMSLFAGKGFETTTVDEITRRADVAKGTFFSYFPSKRAVLIDYYQELDARFHAWVKRLDSMNPEDALARYYGKAERLLRAEGRLARVLVEAISIEPDLGALDRESGDSIQGYFTTFLDEARRRGKIDRSVDPSIAAQVLTDIWGATARAWYDRDCRFSLSRTLAEKTHVLFLGLWTRFGGRRDSKEAYESSGANRRPLSRASGMRSTPTRRRRE